MSKSDAPGRGPRLPRGERRAQLIAAAREVFARAGYHASAMDEIAEAAGVSKPVLYQHFPGKLELYLAVLDDVVAELVEEVRAAIEAPVERNRDRLSATVAAYFAFIDRSDEPFRIVFESDLTSEQAVRERMDSLSETIAEMASAIIGEDTGLDADSAQILGIALTGMAQVSARHWLATGRRVPREQAVALLSRLSWRGIRDFPATGSAPGSAPGPGGSSAGTDGRVSSG